ncbi:hypothetical protein BDR03DRAFT_984342 [Suillus americanus]|nr:hypothetical protein BDR03DRAFT_984342 [Suillus americanus]
MTTKSFDVESLKANSWALKVNIDFTLQQYLFGSLGPAKLAIRSSHNIKFCTVLNGTTVNLIDPKYLVEATVESLYGKLKQDQMLSDKDATVKTPRITLCLFLLGTMIFKKYSKTSMYQLRNRWHKVLVRGGKGPDQSANAPMLEYETFKIKCVTCSMDYCENEDKIMVARGWQAHIKMGKPYMGYLGQGLMKFIFCGRYNNNECAVLQCDVETQVSVDAYWLIYDS